MKKMIIVFLIGCLSCSLFGESVKDYSPAERKDWSVATCRHFIKVAATPAHMRLLFLGDSITYQWLIKPNAKFPGGSETWSKNFSFARNFGISGDRIEHLLWRITAGKQLDGCQFSVIILMIGSNNIMGRKGESPEQVVHGIQQILRIIQEKQQNAKILLLSMPPLSFTGDAKDQAPLQAVPLLKKLEDGKTVFFLDITDIFLDEKRKVILMNDGVHPSPAGYEKMAARILPKFIELEKMAETEKSKGVK